MPDPAERFLAAATAPLGDDAELQAMARRELESCLTAGDEAALTVATQRLEAGGSGSRKWRTGLFIVTAVVSIVTLGLAGRNAAHYLKLLNIIELSGSGPSERRIEALPVEGTHGQPAAAVVRRHFQIPAVRTDEGVVGFRSGESCFTLPTTQSASSGTASGSRRISWQRPPGSTPTTPGSRSRPRRPVPRDRSKKEVMSVADREAGAPPTYRVLDAARLGETLRLLGKAAEQKGFDSYRDDLLAARIRLLPKRSDVASQVIPLAHVGAPPWTTYAFVRLSEAVAPRLGGGGEPGCRRFPRTAADWDRCLELDAREESGSVWNSMFREAAVSVTSQRFADSAGSLGLDAEKRKWGSREAQLKRIRDERRTLDSGDGIKLRSSMITHLYLSPLVDQTARAPGITDGDLKPARMADHELFSRLAAAGVLLALCFMLAGAALYPCRGNTLVRRLSQRMERLLQPGDWAWILGGGIVLPFVWQFVIQRLTPMGARDWSIAASGFLVPSGQVAATGFLMVVLPVLIARWRLGKRGRCSAGRKAALGRVGRGDLRRAFAAGLRT